MKKPINLIKEDIENNIRNDKNEIKQLVDEDNYTEVIHLISKLAFKLYDYNQTYTDDDLEEWLKVLEANINVGSGKLWKHNNKKKVLFYDGFGLDTRGLVQIYIRALSELGYDIEYITVWSGKGKQPCLMKDLQRNDAEVIYLPDEYKIDLYSDICRHIERFQPDIGFLYTTPWDTAVILAFMHFAGKMCRYQINLTDHAFWLGRNAFDYCLEFRDFGASLSSCYRKIPAKKLLVQPYYPPNNDFLPFEGYPFVRQQNDFLIFSGGSIYKTKDNENTYYRLMAWILETFPQVKFWFASNQSCEELQDLLRKFPKRVFCTKERKDLYEVISHADLYINTIPMAGGLMTQFSAVAGRIPLTLCLDEGEHGFLLDENSVDFIYRDISAFKRAVKRYIEDDDYRHEQEKLIKKTVITPKKFNENLERIMVSHTSAYQIHPFLIDDALIIQKRQFFNRYINAHYPDQSDGQ